MKGDKTIMRVMVLTGLLCLALSAVLVLSVANQSEQIVEFWKGTATDVRDWWWEGQK